MKNKRFWLGMLVIVLVFGMTVVGCSGNRLSGTWQDARGRGIKFTGNKFKVWAPESIYVADSNTIFGDYLIYLEDQASRDNGTYSISDNKIEIVYSDGHIKVCSFSRTENTLTINGYQLTRQK